MSTATMARRSETSARPRDYASRRPRVLSERLFKSALVRERKRADRSSSSLMLALITIDGTVGAASWLKVVDGVAAARRETDLVGWFERQAAIGIIMPQLPGEKATGADAIACLQAELERRLDLSILERVSIRLHVHPESAESGAALVHPIDELIGRPSRRTIYDFGKRALDIVGSLAILIVLSPLFLLIAALIKLKSPGPVFFRQTRVGQMRKTFTCFKFRTMYVNADHAIHQQFVSSFIKAGPEAQEAGKKGVFKITDDPRVTPIGRFLRKTSLDELPQFWNVLRGEMSLVGPRPPVPYEVEQYQPWHCRRVLEAKPGITGLWQVNGRSRTTFDEMVRLDLRYAKACSLWTDLKILLATPKAVVAGKGAC